MRRAFTACAAPFESRAEETDEVETTPSVHTGSVQTLEGMTGESAAAKTDVGQPSRGVPARKRNPKCPNRPGGDRRHRKMRAAQNRMTIALITR